MTARWKYHPRSRRRSADHGEGRIQLGAAAEVAGETWAHPYPREQAAFPLPWVRQAKYWPPVKRVDNVHGDRNLVCTCAPMEAYAQAAE